MNTMTIGEAIWTLVGAVCACALAIGVLWIREADDDCALPWGHYGMPDAMEMEEMYPTVVPVVEAVPVPVAVVLP